MCIPEIAMEGNIYQNKRVVLFVSAEHNTQFVQQPW